MSFVVVDNYITIDTNGHYRTWFYNIFKGEIKNILKYHITILNNINRYWDSKFINIIIYLLSLRQKVH